jgi:type IV secretion system protein VirB4
MSQFDNLTNLLSQDASAPMLSEKALMKASGLRAQNKKNLEAMRDIGDDVDEEAFVPYACFYNEHTIITKNGELCQTIKITGTNAEQITDALRDDDTTNQLRRLIRKSIKDHVPNDSLAIWLHTIRRNVEMHVGGNFEHNNFADTLNQWWITTNNFSSQYVNEVYLTVVIEGQTSRATNPKAFLRGLIPSRELKWRNDYLDSAFDVLNQTTEKILTTLQQYGASRLGFYQENGIYYSEQLRFLEQLINFVDRPMPVPDLDLSLYLTSGEITFAFNAMEVRAPSGKRRFAAILSLKEYKEASLKVLDQFLELPMEFIVTQSMNFVNPQKVLEQYKEVATFHEYSYDKDIGRLSELTNILASNNNRANDFGEQQLTIFILSDTIDLLEQNIRKSIAFFAKYGLIAIREDLKFEETYWAQLPGNFVFVSRMQRTYTDHIGAFTNLNQMPTGMKDGNHWGEAVTVFPTASGTPYFFNFHDKHVGHTAIIGQPRTGKKVLLHFLLAQAMRFNPTIYYLDINGGNDALIYYLGGGNYTIAAQPAGQELPPLFNPFALSDHPNNKQFLGKWLTVLSKVMGYAPTEEDRAAIMAAVNAIYTLPPNARHLLSFITELGEQAPSYRRTLAAWLPDGKYGHLFTAQGGGCVAAHKIVSFRLTDALEDVALLATVNSLLLQQISDRLDGSPTIIVMEEAWQLLAQTHVAAAAGGWMDFLSQKNAITIQVIEELEEAALYPLTKELFDKTVTRLYMPDEDTSDVYYEVYGLDVHEMAYLEMMEVRERHFMIKHAGETLVGEMKLKEMQQYLPILDGNAQNYEAEEFAAPNRKSANDAFKQVDLEAVLEEAMAEEEEEDIADDAQAQDTPETPSA